MGLVRHSHRSAQHDVWGVQSLCRGGQTISGQWQWQWQCHSAVGAAETQNHRPAHKAQPQTLSYQPPAKQPAQDSSLDHTRKGTWAPPP
jgi:hypothetical protein